jgi:hypothetical protein
VPRARLAVLTVIAAAVAVGLYVVSDRSTDDVDQPSEPATHRDAPPGLLVDADSHGAIVLLGDEFIGHSRSGDVRWRRPFEELQGFSNFICGERCPDLVASGAGVRGPADPPPLVIGDAALPDEWLRSNGGVNVVLAADAAGALRYVTGPGGSDPEWEMTSPAGGARRLRASGSGVIAFPRTADRTGLYLRTSSDDERSTNYLFARGGKGWRPIADGPAGGAACVGAGGSRWVLGTTLHEKGQAARELDASIEYSACALARSAVVVSQNVSAQDGPHTSVAFLDLAGRELGTVELDDEATVSASEATDMVAIALTQRAEVTVYDARGDERRTLRGYSAAQFDERGDLCVLTSTGSPRWLDAARL